MEVATYQSIFRPGLFQDQIIIVTGGGSGIGRCTAHELAALGASVELLGRRPDRLTTVADEIARSGGEAVAHACDIRDEDAVKTTVARIVAARGRIDALVNNAGGQFPAPLKDISRKGWDAVVQTNLSGGFLMARESLNQSMHERGGAIVNIVADTWGGMPYMGHSGAARAGMINFTQTAAYEWAQFGVRVNAVAPGYVASSGLDAYPAEFAPVLRQMPQSIPLRRFATEAEIAAGIVFLLSPAASFITGTVLRIDGGRPNARVGFPLPSQRSTVAFEGFHLATMPKVLGEG